VRAERQVREAREAVRSAQASIRVTA